MGGRKRKEKNESLKNFFIYSTLGDGEHCFYALDYFFFLEEGE